MKILLINSNRFKYPWPVIPIGLCSVAASVEQAGHKVSVLDLCFSRNCVKDISTAINTLTPDITGISIRNIDNSAGYNTQFFLEEVKNTIINPIKERFKGPIIIGGPAVGISGAEMLEFFDLQYAIRGDGETVIIEFLERLKNNIELKGLQGLIIREKGHIIQDPPPLRVEDLSSLPFPKPHKYINLTPYKQFNSPIQIQTKRGCELKCSYCTYNRIEGNKYRYYQPEIIAQEIETIVKETGINHIEFTDSTFNIPLAHTKAVLRELEKRKLNLRLRTMGLNPGAVDEELVDLMQKVGFHDVDLGAEAGCDVILKNLGKNYRTKDLLQAGKLLQSKNIPVTWYLLVGDPEETQETLKETFNTIKQAACPWDLINIGVGIRVYQGSPLAEQMISDKTYSNKDNFFHPVSVNPKKIDLKAVKILTKQTALRNPNFFMYDEDENTPMIILKLGFFLLKKFAPRQPIWRLHILIRTIEKWIGIGLIKTWIFEFKNRHLLRKLS